MAKQTGKKTANGLETKAFMVSADDIETVKTVRSEDGLSSDSAALRQLIQDGIRFRAIKREVVNNLSPMVQRELAKETMKAVMNDNSSFKPKKSGKEKSSNERV